MAKSGRCASMSEAIASNIGRQLHVRATPQRPPLTSNAKLCSSLFYQLSNANEANRFNTNCNLIINHAKLSTRTGRQCLAESSVG